MAPQAKDNLRTWINGLGPHGLGVAILLVLWKLIVYPEVEQNRLERAKLFELAEKTSEVATTVRESATAAQEAARASETAARINEAIAKDLRSITDRLYTRPIIP